MPRHVDIDEDGEIARLTLDRPARHNSLVPSLLEELREGIVTADAGAAGAIVLGAAEESFSTGGDLRAFHDHRDDIEAFADRIVGALNEVILALSRCETPVVTAVDGAVTGGSVGLLLGSDIVFVSPGASVTPYYARVGFSPDGGWTALMPAVIGPARTAEVLLADRTIPARQAVEWGLAAAEVARVDAHATRVARRLAGLEGSSQARVKRLVGPPHDELAARLEAERRAFVEQIGTEPARRGIAEYLGLDDPPS